MPRRRRGRLRTASSSRCDAVRGPRAATDAPGGAAGDSGPPRRLAATPFAAQGQQQMAPEAPRATPDRLVSSPNFPVRVGGVLWKGVGIEDGGTLAEGGLRRVPRPRSDRIGDLRPCGGPLRAPLSPRRGRFRPGRSLTREAHAAAGSELFHNTLSRRTGKEPDAAQPSDGPLEPAAENTDTDRPARPTLALDCVSAAGRTLATDCASAGRRARLRPGPDQARRPLLMAARRSARRRSSQSCQTTSNGLALKIDE